MILSKADRRALDDLRVLGVADSRVGRLADILCKIVEHIERQEGDTSHGNPEDY